jgi:hypothetical protein
VVVPTTLVTWGGYGDVPAPDDYDGVRVRRITISTQWGANGDQPVSAPLPSWKNPMYW